MGSGQEKEGNRDVERKKMEAGGANDRPSRHL